MRVKVCVCQSLVSRFLSVCIFRKFCLDGTFPCAVLGAVSSLFPDSFTSAANSSSSSLTFGVRAFSIRTAWKRSIFTILSERNQRWKTRSWRDRALEKTGLLDVLTIGRTRGVQIVKCIWLLDLRWRFMQTNYKYSLVHRIVTSSLKIPWRLCISERDSLEVSINWPAKVYVRHQSPFFLKIWAHFFPIVDPLVGSKSWF